MQFSRKKLLPLCPYEEITTHFKTVHGNFLIPWQMVLLANINSLRSKQNTIPKNWSQNIEAVGWYYYSYLSLETVFLTLKLAQICCINMNISFLEKRKSKQIGSLSPIHLPSLKYYPHDLTNMKLSEI